MAGAIHPYDGPRLTGPVDEKAYDDAVGHTNYGAGAAATPFVEAKLPADALRARRDEVRATLWNALIRQAGDPRQVPVSWNDVTFVAPATQAKATRQGTAYTKQRFYFDSPLFGGKVSGIILIPSTATTAHGSPAVMYNHFHGGLYQIGTNEVEGSFIFAEHGSFGEYLVDEGYVVFAVDVLGFNERRFARDTRPHSADNPDDLWDELGYTQQMQALGGRSRFAARTYEDILAFRLLQQHPLVDPRRISAMGMSMGCVRSYAMAAFIGDELRSIVALGTFPRWQDLVLANRKGAHRNAHFLTAQIDDLHLDNEAMLLAASSTNVMAIMGDSPGDPQDGMVRPSSPDPSSPGWPTIFDYASYVSATLGGTQFQPVSVPFLGHAWSQALADQAIAFINQHTR
jgi:dienelactone hydrolase